MDRQKIQVQASSSNRDWFIGTYSFTENLFKQYRNVRSWRKAVVPANSQLNSPECRASHRSIVYLAETARIKRPKWP
jgi:hypothetical protein